MRIQTTAALAILFLALPALSWAGSFKAVPIKLYLDSRTKTAVLKVTNDGAEKVTVQMEAVSWTQDESGKDVYKPTKDIIFFPKMASIEKGEEKILRVGYEGKKTEANEKTYRLFIQEIPVSKPGEVAIKMAVRMGIPVFIKPDKAAEGISLDSLNLSEGTLKVRVKNSGNSHFIVGKITATGLTNSSSEAFRKETTGWYVLNGGSRVFPVDVTREECLKAGAIKVEAEVEKKTVNGTLEVKPEMCADKPKEPAREAPAPASAPPAKPAKPGKETKG